MTFPIWIQSFTAVNWLSIWRWWWVSRTYISRPRFRRWIIGWWRRTSLFTRLLTICTLFMCYGILPKKSLFLKVSHFINTCNFFFKEKRILALDKPVQQRKAGVRQACTMSAMLFNMTIDWVMRCTTEDQSRGIRWTVFSTLEDLDFAADLALVSHAHQHVQKKTTRLNTYAQ